MRELLELAAMERGGVPRFPSLREPCHVFCHNGKRPCECEEDHNYLASQGRKCQMCTNRRWQPVKQLEAVLTTIKSQGWAYTLRWQGQLASCDIWTADMGWIAEALEMPTELAAAVRALLKTTKEE